MLWLGSFHAGSGVSAESDALQIVALRPELDPGKTQELVLELPAANAPGDAWEVWLPQGKRPAATGRLQPTPSATSIRVRVAGTGRQTACLLIHDATGGRVRVATCEYGVTPGRIERAVGSAMGLLLAALVGVLSFFVQEFVADRRRKGEGRQRIRARLRHVLDQHLAWPGLPTVLPTIPAWLSNPGSEDAPLELTQAPYAAIRIELLHNRDQVQTGHVTLEAFRASVTKQLGQLK